MKELEIFKLEDRVLFEAAAAAEIVDAAEAAQYDPNADVSENDRQAQAEQDALKNAPPENPAAAAAENPVNDDPAEIASVDAEIEALINGDIPSGKELVVINGSVVDKETIIDSLQPGQDVLILKNGSGLAELNEYLDQNGAEYSAIHLLTHGNDGYVSINGERIDAGNFDTAAWQEIGEHLTEDGDILLYSCNTASGAAGKALINMISAASGADAAASSDITGISGNWVLEYSSGSVETSEIEIDGFNHNLTNYTVDTAEDVVDDTDGVTSLREAIEAANDSDGADEITFADALDGQVIKLDNGALDIEEALTITGNGTVNTIIDGQSNDTIFSVRTFDDIQLNISDLTLQNGLNSGNNGGAIDITALGDASLSLENVTITGCEADSGSGGAISIYADGTVNLDIVNSTITGNYALDEGGAVYLQSDSFTVNVVNSTITGNSSDSLNTHTGAGLYLQQNNNSSLNILNSIIYGNTNTSSGSAADIYVDNQTADIHVALNVIHSIYGEINDGADGETFEPSDKTGSTQLDYSSANTQRVFGTDSPKLQNGVIQVNNQDIAGYSGTLTARDNNGEYIFFDHSGSWKGLDGNAVSAPADADIISVDQIGTDRTAAKDILGVNEFFVGAAAGKVYLAVAPQGASYKYDGEVKTADVVYTTAKGTVITPDAAAALGTVLSASGITTSAKDAGIYKFDSVTAAVSNNGSDVTGKFELDIDQTSSIEITKRSVTLTSADGYKIYDGTALTNSTVTVGGDGFIDGEGATFTVTGTQTDAGKSNNTFTCTLNDGTLAGNYDITTIFGTLEVGKRAIVVTANAQVITYGSAVPELTYAVQNIVPGETLNGELQLIDPQFSSSGKLAFGTYVIGQGTLTAAANSNYDIEYRSANFEVNKLDLEVSFTVADKVYDGNTTAALTGAAADNMAVGDDLTIGFSGAVANFSDKNAGQNKVVTVTGGLALSGADAGNYNLVYNYTGTGKIDPKTLDVTVELSTSKVYDGTANVTSAVTVNGVVGDDKVQVTAQWQYNSSDVADADTINNTKWELSGEDKGNYALPTPIPYDGADAEITPKNVEITYVTDAPYYYNGTDQSGTVSAYYTDINGQQVAVGINWDGKIFAAVGTYEISVTVTDSNYQAVNGTYILEMQPNNPAGGGDDQGGDGQGGDYPSSDVIPSDPRTDFISGSSSGYGDVYSMNYPELVSLSFLRSPGGMISGIWSVNGYQLAPVSGAVQLDVLKYLPMTIDNPVRESSVAEAGWTVNPAALSSGQELFESSSDALIQVRGDAPVTAPESLYIDGDADAQTLPWYENPAQEQALNGITELSLPEDLPVKSRTLSSEFEKLLEELVLA